MEIGVVALGFIIVFVTLGAIIGRIIGFGFLTLSFMVFAIIAIVEYFVYYSASMSAVDQVKTFISLFVLGSLSIGLAVSLIVSLINNERRASAIEGPNHEELCEKVRLILSRSSSPLSREEIEYALAFSGVPLNGIRGLDAAIAQEGTRVKGFIITRWIIAPKVAIMIGCQSVPGKEE